MAKNKKAADDTSAKASGSAVMRCGVGACRAGPAAEYQDARYGPGNRVHNRTKSKWTCSVCGNQKGA